MIKIFIKKFIQNTILPFLQVQNVVSGLKVVNDAGEHSVKFEGDYTDIITTDEAR